MYNQQEIKNQLLEAIEREGCTSFGEAASYVAPAVSTLYEWELEKSEDIKNALIAQRTKAKAKLKKRWQNSESAPVLQLAAYKLMADEDELERLSVTVNQHKGEIGIKQITGMTVK